MDDSRENTCKNIIRLHKIIKLRSYTKEISGVETKEMKIFNSGFDFNTIDKKSVLSGKKTKSVKLVVQFFVWEQYDLSLFTHGKNHKIPISEKILENIISLAVCVKSQLLRNGISLADSKSCLLALPLFSIVAQYCYLTVIGSHYAKESNASQRILISVANACL